MNFLFSNASTPFAVVSENNEVRIIMPKQHQALANLLQRLSLLLIVSDLLNCQCRAVRVPRSARSRHTVFVASLKRARLPLHNLVAQVKHKTAESRCPDVYTQKIKQALFTFKRKLVALQRAAPLGASSDMNELLHSANTVVRRIKSHTTNLDMWIADRAKWWKTIKSNP
jgi:hypothetical protein